MTMLVYPQLIHYPLIKRRNARTILNRMADGRAVRLADPGGEIRAWRLEYAELDDDEIQTIEAFFRAAEGTLNPFLFVDPLANLVDGRAWVKGPLLAMTGGPEEYRLANAGGGPQGIEQTIGGPAGFVYCFSGRMRADQACAVTISAGNMTSEQAVSGAWERFMVTAQTAEPTFGLELPAGSTVDVRDLQIEAQPGASAYRSGTGEGIYEDARLGDDTLEIVTMGPNRHRCAVNIIHANHI
jgi:hypothetical protein